MAFAGRFESAWKISKGGMIDFKGNGCESVRGITESHLKLKAKIPGATKEAFEKATEAAKSGCPVSKLYNTKITLDARLEG